MSNYTQVTLFTPKDALTTGDPVKKAKGADVDAEFAAISAAIVTKYDAASSVISTGNGAAATPSFAFANSLTTGFYRGGADIIGIATAGVSRGTISAVGAWAIPPPTSGVALTVSSAPSAGSQPTAVFQTAASSSFIKINTYESTSGYTGILGIDDTGMYLQTNAGRGVRFLTNSVLAMSISPSGGNVQIVGAVGFNNASPLAKPTITGSKAGNAAVTSLLAALVSYGLIIDATT